MVVNTAPTSPDTSTYEENRLTIDHSFHRCKYRYSCRFVQWYVRMVVITYSYGTDTAKIIRRSGRATPLRRSRAVTAPEPAGAEQTDPATGRGDRRASVRSRAPRSGADRGW